MYVDLVQFKDDNYFCNLDDEIRKIVLMKNIDNECDELCKFFILDAANNKASKKLVIKSQHKSCDLSNFDIIKEEEVDLKLNFAILATKLTSNDQCLIDNVIGGVIDSS